MEEISKHDIYDMLRYSDLDKEAIRAEVERLRKSIGGEFLEDRYEREEAEKYALNRKLYSEYTDRISKLKEDARFFVIEKGQFYIINRSKTHIITALVRCYKEGGILRSQAENDLNDIVSKNKQNADKYKSYPVFYVFENDYEVLFHEYLEDSIPAISMKKKMIVVYGKTVVDISPYLQKHKNMSYEDTFYKAIEIMFAEGY